MNSLQIFNNPNFGEIRSFFINDEPWFAGKDVADILGYRNGSRDINRHVDEEDRRIITMNDGVQDRQTIIINESGLYSLVLSSKLPKAKEFKRWVTNEVLPSIRKTGGYNLPKDYPSALRALADSYEENEKLKIENNKLRTYVDTILESKEALTMTQIAKDYDMTCQQANKIAHDEGIQYKVNDQWVLYKKHMGKGYTTSETFCKETDGVVVTKVYTKWTQKGRLMLHEVFTKRGILPHMDKEIVNS